MESRISATGLKSVELDELTTDQIIINNEGLQYLHKYNILLPTMTEGYYNLQEELDKRLVTRFKMLNYSLYQMHYQQQPQILPL